MIRLINNYNDYVLVDTDTKEELAKCLVLGGYCINIRDCVNVIWNVYVAEEFRRQGFATIMLQRIIKKYKDSRPLILYVYKDNVAAISLYEKLGFEIIGEYDGKENAWTMQYVGGR